MELSSGQVIIQNLPVRTRPARMFVGDDLPNSIPLPANSRAGDNYLHRPTGDVYELGAVGMEWELVANIKGPAGNTDLSPAERAILLEDLQDDLDFDIDPVVLFNNAIA